MHNHLSCASQVSYNSAIQFLFLEANYYSFGNLIRFKYEVIPQHNLNPSLKIVKKSSSYLTSVTGSE